MRFLIRARLRKSLETKWSRIQTFTKLEEYVTKVKPEAAYFMPIEGHRAGAFIVNIDSNEQVPAMVQ